MAIAVVLLAALTACTAPAGDARPPSSTSSLNVTDQTSTTTTDPPTTTTANSTTTTTTTTISPPPTTLDIDGSPLIEFSIDDQDGLDPEVERSELVAFVAETLTDQRSWTGQGVGFRLVDSGGLFTITVADPDRVDSLCRPLRTLGRYSCARNGWIAINRDRWFGATDSWPADLDSYRRYLINHEVGHYILGPGHPGCPGLGQLAPIMMQQTKGLNGCEANGWVDP